MRRTELAVRLGSTTGSVGPVELGHRREPEVSVSRGPCTAALSGRLRNPARLEDLVDAWLARGPASLEGVRGDFVLVLRDPQGVHLVRDGAGVRTLYWTRLAGGIAWSVEPKGLWSQPGFDARIRPAGVARYLAFSFQPGADTLLEGLHELRPGHRLHVDPHGQVTESRWFHFESTLDLAHDDPSRVAAVRDDLRSAIAERLPPTGPIGVFLSGGIDSSVVAAELVRMVDRPVYSYTIHFGDEYVSERHHAAEVARWCGTIHHEVCVRPEDFAPHLDRVAWHLDDPIGDPITVPNFELAARARQDVDAIFNGEGGDPCFGGPKNITMLLQQWYQPNPGPGARERWYLASYRRAYEEMDHLIQPALRDRIDATRDLEAVLTPFFETDRPQRFLEKLLAINIRLKGGHLILPKVDRMLGAHGLAALSPLFDERMLGHAMALPARLKVHGGVEKVVLKKAYADDLPHSVIDRPKSGMRVPVHWWLKHELHQTCREILLSREATSAGVFRPDRVRELLTYEALDGGGRYGLRLWMLMTFELWRRTVGARLT